jgi:hypothetical protein
MATKPRSQNPPLDRDAPSCACGQSLRREEIRIEPTRIVRPGGARSWGRGACYYQWVCDHCGYRGKPEPPG